MVQRIFQNCFFVDSPRFRHDLVVSYQHLCEHLLNTTQVAVRNVKKLLQKRRVADQPSTPLKEATTLSQLMEYESFFGEEEKNQLACVEQIRAGLLRCNEELVVAIRAGLPTHSLLIISDLLSVTSRSFGPGVAASALYQP